MDKFHYNYLFGMGLEEFNCVACQEGLTLGAQLSLMLPVCRALGCTICSTVDIFNFNQSQLGITAVKLLAARTSLQ